MQQIARSAAPVYVMPALPAFSVFALLLLFAAAPAFAKLDRQAYPTEPPTGMQELNSREFDIVYVKPGFQPGDYGKLIIEEPQVVMDDYWEWNYRRELTERDLKRIETSTAKILREQFAAKLSAREGFTLVGSGEMGGEGALRLRPSMIELNLHAPDLMRSHKDTWVRSAGNATLYLDLYAVDSGELLLRVIDRDLAREHNRLYEANRATNYHDLRIMVSRWATALRKHLDALNSGTA